MPKELTPAVWQWPATPDGFAEVTLEVNGVILATTVVAPNDNYDAGHADCLLTMDFLRRELNARC